MAIKSPEPVAVIKKRRNKALSKLIKSIPYISFLGVEFDRRGDEITAILPFKNDLVGNPNLPALHGGSIAAFLEISAIIELSWMQIWREIENPKLKADYLIDLEILSLPKTIDFSVDYLRSGLPRTLMHVLKLIEWEGVMRLYMLRHGRIIEIDCLPKGQGIF